MMSFSTNWFGSVWIICMLSTFLCSAKPTNALTTSSFEFFQVPGAANLVPSSLNDSLYVTGYYNFADGVMHGFVRTGCGKLTTFDVGQVMTEPIRINAGGDVAGVFSDVSGFDQGFVRSAHGVITRFNLAGSGGSTELTDINASGTVVGLYSTTNSFPPSQAFFRTRNGEVATFTVPRSTWVYPESINDAGEITGFYFFDGGYDGGVGGFVRAPDGTVTTFNYPGGIVPLAMNQGGTIAGWYAPPTGAFAPFVRQPSGVITRIRLPGTLSTQYMGINQAGFIAGSYTTMDKVNLRDREKATHGFIRTPQAAIASFDVPGGNNTLLTAINDLSVATGYSDSTTSPGGFLLVPGGPLFSDAISSGLAF